MMQANMKRFGPAAVTVLLLAGAIVLGILQYRWVSVSSSAEEARTRSLIGRGAAQVAGDAAEEVRVLLSLARVTQADLAAMDWDSLTSSLDLWYANAPYPELLQGLYIVRGMPATDVLLYDHATGRFKTAFLPAAVKAALSVSGGGPRTLPSIALDEWHTAVVQPVMAPDQPRAQGPVGAVVVTLDTRVIYGKIVPYYMKRSLADYPYRVVAVEGGEVLAASAASPVGRAPEISVGMDSVQVEEFGRGGPSPQPDGSDGTFSIDPLLQSWLQRAQGALQPAASPPQQPSVARLEVYYPNRTLAGAMRAQEVLSLVVAFGILAFLVASAVVLARMYRRNALLRASEQEFVASISHELRTPIAVIQATSENLKRGVVSDPARLPKYAEVINGQIRRLSGMVEGILLYSGLQSGRTRTPALAAVDIGALVKEALHPLEQVAAERGSTLHLTLESLPTTACTDAMAVRLVIENLVMNAIRHADPGEIRITAGRRAFDTLRITVEDAGPGIPAREQARVFEPFVRGQHSAQAQVPGSGLGLHLVRRVASLLGGKAELQSPYQGLAGKAQKGCRFVVTLPCREACDEDKG